MLVALLIVVLESVILTKTVLYFRKLFQEMKELCKRSFLISEIIVVDPENNCLLIDK